MMRSKLTFQYSGNRERETFAIVADDGEGGRFVLSHDLSLEAFEETVAHYEAQFARVREMAKRHARRDPEA